MEKVAKVIVKYRYIFAIVMLALVIASIFTINLVEIEESVAAYLPDDTNTKRALKIMEKEFVTYGSTTILVKNVTLEHTDKLIENILNIKGVKSVDFDSSKNYNKEQKKALLSVTFEGGVKDDVSVKAYDDVIKALDKESISIPTPLYSNFADTLAKDIKLVLGLCAVIILIILLLTSKSYAEVLVFPIVFISAAILNMGTNYWFHKISFVSNTVCVILQLALAIDYSIILCHRFTDEKLKFDSPKEAMVSALSKAIPEILSSCLTTISGLLALVTMQLKLGQDLGLVLAKSILFSILVVIVLMPTLLLWVSKWMDKTKHKSFIPKFKLWTKGMLKARKVLPIVFVCFVIVFGICTIKIDYSYALNCIDTNKPTDVQVAIKEREEAFGYDNLLVVLVPKEEKYHNERDVINAIKKYEKTEQVESVLGISDIKFNGTYIVDSVGYKQFAKMIGQPASLAKMVYSAYIEENNLSTSIERTRVPVMTMAKYAINYAKKVGIELPEEMNGVEGLLKDAEDQLIGDNYTRVLVKINYPQEGDEVFAFTTALEKELKKIDDGVIFAGESMSAYDLSKSFETDTFIISILTGVFVYIILLFTFKSWALPIALVAVIQGAILINFGLIPIFGKNFFFFVYLIVSAIQMGATIDYAIIVTNHYREERKIKPKEVAIYDAMSASFPAIITSGTIMVIAPLFVGIFISDPLVSSLGYCLARGSFISILSVLTVLPELLYTFERAFLKTTFRYSKKEKKLEFVQDSVVIDTAPQKLFYDDSEATIADNVLADTNKEPSSKVEDDNEESSNATAVDDDVEQDTMADDTSNIGDSNNANDVKKVELSKTEKVDYSQNQGENVDDECQKMPPHQA